MEKKFEVFSYHRLPSGEMVRCDENAERWERIPLYCPRCGKQGLWERRDEGRGSYVGIQHICVDCENTFYLLYGISDIYHDENDIQRLKHLKA